MYKATATTFIKGVHFQGVIFAFRARNHEVSLCMKYKFNVPICDTVCDKGTRISIYSVSI